MDFCLSVENLFLYLEATPSSRCINEGQAVLNAGHIIKCGVIEKHPQKIKLLALCLKSSGLNDSPHELVGTFEWDEDHIVSVDNVTCSCKAGQSSRCKHAAALLFLCSRNRKRQCWVNKPTDQEFEVDMKLNRIFENAGMSSNILNLPIIMPDRECSKKQYHDIGRSCYIEIARSTLNDKLLWMFERKFRITGSRCYGLHTYKGNDWHIKSLKYFWPKGFKSESTQYGIDTEVEARTSYATKLKYEVKQTGVIICQKHPWLAYSPDGIVFENGFPVRLLEIKCPVKGKTCRAIDLVHELNYFVIENDRLTIKKKHAYYAQIQMRMALLNLPECDFIIYSKFSKDFLNIKFLRDHFFIEIL